MCTPPILIGWPKKADSRTSSSVVASAIGTFVSDLLASSTEAAVFSALGTESEGADEAYTSGAALFTERVAGSVASGVETGVATLGALNAAASDARASEVPLGEQTESEPSSDGADAAADAA
jgi:hypothetical protein